MRNIMKTVLAVSVLALMATGVSMVSFAAGWEAEDGGWVYRDRHGGYVTDAWKKSGNHYYYLDENGRMAVNALIEYEGEKYYVGEDGARVTSKWISIPNEDGVWDQEVSAIWYRFGSGGKACRDRRKTVDGKIFLFDDEGHMLSGWQTYGGGEDLYYLGNEDEGWAYTGWQYLEPGGESYDSYDGEKWFYFNPANGKAYRDTRKFINGRYYTFDDNGVMKDKWVFGTPGAADDATLVTPGAASYYDEGTGGQQTGWVYTYGPDDPDENGDKEWYYLDSHGVPFNDQGKDSITDMGGKGFKFLNGLWDASSEGVKTQLAARVINNKTYLFDKDGKMLTGLYFLTGIKRAGGSVLGEFVNNNDFSYWTGKPYYFNPKEGSAQGQMMTGKHTITDDNGDEYYYYFQKNGQAYTNTIVDGCLYGPDGARIFAKDDSGYRIITAAPGSPIREKGSSRIHKDCQLIVNERGKVIKSGTVTFDGVKYTIENYEIVSGENVDS